MLHYPFLRKLASVAVLTSGEKQAAIDLCHDVHTISRRKDIVSEGTSLNCIHVILQGWAARYNLLPNGSRRITAFLLPGDICDIHATALECMDHSILTLSNCKVASITAKQINKIAELTPSLTHALWRSTLVDEAILRRWLLNSSRSDAFTTVGHLLGELYVRASLVGLVNGYTLEMPVTQEEMGDATGLSAVHVNRVLKRLRNAGIATVKRGSLVIDNAEALRIECGFNPDYLHLSTHDGHPYPAVSCQLLR